MLVEKIEKPIAYKPDEAARLITVSPRKMDELIATKQIRSFKVGKSRRISAEALQEFIKTQEKAAR